MVQILISLVGIAVVYRNLSLLEKFEVITKKKMFLCFIVLQVPLFLFVFFKEQIAFTLLFIGIFLITLIFSREIFEKLARITYEKRHLLLLDQLIFLLKTGKSAQTSLKSLLQGLTTWEKNVFRPLEFIFEIQSVEKKSILMPNQFYFEELKVILKSNHKISEQLISFRSGLKIRRNLRHKSRQVTQQIRAQAIVAILIYLVFLFVSFTYFNLKAQIMLLFTSLVLFAIGLISVFLLGGKIKWKT